MKATELRIGNWVDCPILGGVKVVSSISEDQLELSEGNRYWMPHPEAVNPILLTEQWLEWFGFEYDILERIYIKGRMYVSLNRNGIHYGVRGYKARYYWEEQDHQLDINLCGSKDKLYVHTIQNVYFALTGEELERKQ